MNYYQTPPFEKYAKRVVAESNNMYSYLQKGEERPWYHPNGATSRVASRALAGLSGGLKGIFLPAESDFQNSEVISASNSKPSAVTTSDGIKMSDNKRLSRFGQIMAKRMKKNKKKLPKKLKKVLGQVKRKYGMGVRGRPRKLFPRGRGGRVVSAPVARGPIYRGSTLRMKNTVRDNMNCSRMSTKANIGKLQVYAASGAPTAALKPNGTDDLGGQWFFAPTMTKYWPVGSQTLNMALMYQYFYLKNVWFEFESLYQPGNTAGYNVVWSFIENPNLGETTIASYTSTLTLTSAQLLQNNLSGSFPAFTPRHVIAPPARWYSNKRFVTRSYSLLGPVSTSSTSTVSQNVQNIPFALWLAFDGATPGSTIDISRIFIHYDIEFCDIAATQIYNNVGGSTFFDSELEVKSLRKELNALTQQLGILSVSDQKDRRIGDDDSPYIKLKAEELVDLPLSFRHTNQDIIKLVTPKSTSNKSNR